VVPLLWEGFATPYGTRSYAASHPGAMQATCGEHFRWAAIGAPLTVPGAAHWPCLACSLPAHRCGRHALRGRAAAAGAHDVRAGQRVRGEPWLYLSSLGIGSYLGDADEETDERVRPCTTGEAHRDLAAWKSALPGLPYAALCLACKAAPAHQAQQPPALSADSQQCWRSQVQTGAPPVQSACSALLSRLSSGRAPARRR